MGSNAKISRRYSRRPSIVLIPKHHPFQALATPSFTFSFISCLEGSTVGGNKNLFSCCLQAAASSLFALFFTGKSLNSPPKAGLFPRATPWTGIQSCGQRAVSTRAGAFGSNPTQASSDCCLFGTEASLARSQPPVASEERLWASELAGVVNNFVLLLLMSFLSATTLEPLYCFLTKVQARAPFSPHSLSSVHAVLCLQPRIWGRGRAKQTP